MLKLVPAGGEYVRLSPVFPCIGGSETMIVTEAGNDGPEEDNISCLENSISCVGVRSIERDSRMKNRIKTAVNY